MRQASFINVVALPAHGEHWVLLYDDRHVSLALRQLGVWASRPDLAFTWYDATRLSSEIRRAQERNHV